MPLLTFDRLELAYGHWPLLDGASLVVEAGERIGLIGRNGTGKSSLLKIIAGESQPDAGEVWRAPGLKLAYVPQEPQFQPGHSVFEAVAEGVGAAQKLLAEYHAVAHAMAEGDAAPEARAQALSCQQAAVQAQPVAPFAGGKLLGEYPCQVLCRNADSVVTDCDLDASLADLAEVDPGGVFVCWGAELPRWPDPFSAGPSGPAPSVIPLGWMQQSPLTARVLARYEVRDIYTAIARGEVYLPLQQAGESRWLFETYLREHHGFSGLLVPTARVARLVVYQGVAAFTLDEAGREVTESPFEG